MGTEPGIEPDEPARSPGGARTASRRAVLAGGATAAAAVAITSLAGCATYGGAAKQPAATGPVPLGKTADIPVGGGKIFATGPVVVTQPVSGTFKCFTAVCTHQGCTVDNVRKGTINCGCHGSQYSITDGSVVTGPASVPLAAESITVTDGAITLG